jgi:hypothetical protein
VCAMKKGISHLIVWVNIGIIAALMKFFGIGPEKANIGSEKRKDKEDGGIDPKDYKKIRKQIISPHIKVG